LSPNETAWLSKRKANVVRALIEFVNQANLTEFNTTSYFQSIAANSSLVPVAAYSISGGGYKSLLTGLGGWQAMDARYPPAVAAKTGGLAQCLTYLLGLSGGSLAVSTLAANNYPTIEQLVPQWNTTVDQFTGPDSSNVEQYFGSRFAEIAPKLEQGFNVTLSDLLGRLFSQYYIAGPQSGISKTWSDIQVDVIFTRANYGDIVISQAAWLLCQSCR
jgi:lysophospholipase